MTTSKIAYTTVINIDGGRRQYSFLPPHGVTMDPNQSITFIGEIHDRLIPGWPYHSDKDRPPNRVKVQALKKAEENGQLLVIRSPATIRHEVLTAKFHRIDCLGVPDPNYKR